MKSSTSSRNLCITTASQIGKVIAAGAGEAGAVVPRSRTGTMEAVGTGTTEIVAAVTGTMEMAGTGVIVTVVAKGKTGATEMATATALEMEMETAIIGGVGTKAGINLERLRLRSIWKVLHHWIIRQEPPLQTHPSFSKWLRLKCRHTSHRRATK